MRPLGSFRSQYAILRLAGDGSVAALRYDRLGRRAIERLYGLSVLIETWPAENRRGWDRPAAWSAIRAACETAGELTERKLNALGLYAMRCADRSWRVRAMPFRHWELPAVQLVGDQGELIQSCLDIVHVMRSVAR